MDPTKKRSSLEVDIFRRYYNDLPTLFSASNEAVSCFTDTLYSKGVIDKSIKDDIHTTTGISAQDKTRRLLDSIEKTLHTRPEKEELFRAFCSSLVQISEIIPDKMLKEYENKELSMDHKTPSQSIQRALSSQSATNLPVKADIADVNNPASQVFNYYYDDLVDAIEDNATAIKMADDLYTNKLISIAEKDRVYQIPSVCIKVKAMFSCLGRNIERGRKDNNQFVNFLNMINGSWQCLPALSILEKEMRAKILFPSVELPKDSETKVIPSPSKLESNRTSENLLSFTPAQTDDSITSYAAYLRSKYKMKQRPDNKWFRRPIQKFVDLAVVIKVDLSDDDEFSRSTIHGNLEDILHKKERISHEDLQNCSKAGSRFLVEGAPGIGKSTLALEFCKKWEKTQLFSEYKLFLMLQLRDKAIQQAKSPSDLFPSDDESLGQNVFKAVRIQRGEGVFIILEGFDELPKELRETDSIFTKLINGDILPDSTVMVTTRHSATEELLSLITIDFSLHLEILGFSKSSIDEYISASFQNKDEISALHTYLDRFPHIKGCLHVPLTLGILMEIYKQQIRPETLTELYTAIVKTLLLRYIDDKSLKLTKLEDLKECKKHPEMFIKFCMVCEFAYNMLCDNQTLVFHELPKDLETFDLIQKESHVRIHSGITYSYSFLHHTIQEYLAAFHICQLPQEEHQQLYEQLTTNSSFVTVLRFFAGLTGLTSINFSIPNEVSNFNLIQQLFESKNIELAAQLFSAKNLQLIHRTWPMPTLQDFYALGWCVRLSNCNWDLGFTFRPLLFWEHIAMLREGIGLHPTGQIEAMRFDLTPIGNKGLRNLLAITPNALKNLLKLSLRGTNLDSSSCRELAIKLSQDLTFLHLQILYFHDNHIECDGHKELIKALCNVTSLKVVSFSRLSPTECSTLLTETNIESIELWQLSHDSVQIISDSIATAKSCLALCVSDSEITVENIECIPQSLQTNTTLQSLELLNCGISCTTAKIIAEAVTNNTSITRLNLDNNLIRDTGIHHIVSMLQTRQLPFEKININRNPIGKESLEEIVRAISQSHPTSVAELTVSLKWKEYICSDLDCKTIECKIIFK